jgi:endonuclease-3
MTRTEWDAIIPLLREHAVTAPVPSVSQIARPLRSPFRVLISTMISLRTKDEVTLAASARLFTAAASPQQLVELPEERIAELIYPAGFYRTKARHIRETSRVLLARYGGSVPDDVESLVELPGVGRKTANLVLGQGFGIPAICVDTHVHRISNRCGWVASNNPEQTEAQLQRVLPRRHWIEINELLVAYGQSVCTPTSPFCSRCSIARHCPRIGVARSR